MDSHLQQLHLTQSHVTLRCLTPAPPALFAHAKHFHQQLQPPSQISSELNHQQVSEALHPLHLIELPRPFLLPQPACLAVLIGDVAQL